MTRILVRQDSENCRQYGRYGHFSPIVTLTLYIHPPCDHLSLPFGVVKSASLVSVAPVKSTFTRSGNFRRSASYTLPPTSPKRESRMDTANIFMCKFVDNPVRRCKCGSSKFHVPPKGGLH